jgi:hypothetical protein
MTLIVGITCSNGIVMAADGAATLATLSGEMSVRQPTRKLRIIDNRMILGVSGTTGLGQRFEAEVRELSRNNAFSRSKVTPEKAMVEVRNRLWKHIEPELKIAEQAQPVVPRARLAALTGTLFAAPIGQATKADPCLFEFDESGAPDLKGHDHNLVFASTGSGRGVADPFLAFLRRIFWPDDSPPSLSEGRLAAVWTLKHAVETCPGFVAEPIQAAVLERSKSGEWEARELTPEELEEHRQACEEIEDELRQIRANWGKESAGAATVPPA